MEHDHPLVEVTKFVTPDGKAFGIEPFFYCESCGFIEPKDHGNVV